MTVNARTAQILDIFDLRENLLSSPPMFHGHYGHTKVDLSTVDTPWPGMWKIQQQDLNNELLIWAIESGARLIRAAKLTNLSTNLDGYVEAEFEGAAKSAASRIVVGCDGEHSSVRSMTGLGEEVSSGHRRFITANLRASHLPTFRFEKFSEGAVVSTGRIDEETYRIMMHLPAYVPSLSTTEDIERAWKMITGVPLQGKVQSWGLQTDRNQLATSFNSSRVLLAGDAAHSQLPVGGCALNYGIEDAFSLAWRIALCLKTDTLDLFDDYSTERKFAAHRMQKFVRNQTEDLYGERPSVERTDATDVESKPNNFAEFLSGVDIDYSSCGTKASTLLHSAEITGDTQQRKLKDAQRTFSYCIPSSGEIDKPLDFAQNEEAHRLLPTGNEEISKAELTVRPDGYLISGM